MDLAIALLFRRRLAVSALNGARQATTATAAAMTESFMIASSNSASE